MGDINFNIEGPRDQARQANNVHIEQAKAPRGAVPRKPAPGDAGAPTDWMGSDASAVHPKHTNGFDVFLCHNSRDKEAVKKIARGLRERGISPWLDEWELRPGVPWQPVIEGMIREGKAVAVFIGRSGLGPWQNVEQQAFLQEFNNRGCAVIPVILPECDRDPDIPIFLNRMTRVDFRKQVPDPLESLIWGITGDKRGRHTDAWVGPKDKGIPSPSSGKGKWSMFRLVSSWIGGHRDPST
jgi:hypothetical protein